MAINPRDLSKGGNFREHLKAQRSAAFQGGGDFANQVREDMRSSGIRGGSR
jgi:hypothetical protein